MLKERQREQEEAAPAEEVFSSQATRCAKREIQIQRRREGERQRERREAAAAARFRGESAQYKSEMREKREERKAMESRSATSSSPKRPPATSPVCTPMNCIKPQDDKKNRKKKSAVLGWCLKSYVNKAH